MFSFKYHKNSNKHSRSLLDADVFLIFQKLMNIIIVCIQVYGANKLLLRYFFKNITKNFEITPNNTKYS